MNMKEVRFLKSVSSVRGAYRKGDVSSIPDKEADHWIAAGYCEEVEAEEVEAEEVQKPTKQPKSKK